MSRKFFITGLPRSRTAWFANLLSDGHVKHCFHEAQRRAPSLPALFRLYDEAPFAVVGDSSCGLLPIWHLIANRYPDAPWVVIHRPVEEVINSCERAFPGLIKPGTLHRLAEHMSSALPNVLRVDFADVDCRIHEILSHLGCNVVPERLAQCLETKVEIIFEKCRLDERVRAMVAEMLKGQSVL